MNQRFVIAIFIAAPAALSFRAWGEPPDKAKAPAANRAAAPDHDGEAEKQQIRLAQEHVKRLSMRVADEAGDAVEAVERPLLFYGDAARVANHGTLWAFGRRGRPAAFMELWRGPPDQPFWYQSLIRTGNQDLRLQSPDGRRWQPPGGEISRTKIDDATPPAASGSARLRQLKSLVRRFTAHEVGDPDNSRFELRLLVQPIHRYDDPPSGVQDGAAFVFAHGTNPELIVLIEALGADTERAAWHYSVFPSSSAQLHLHIDGREAWTRPGAPNVVGRPNDDYWLFSLPVESRLPRDEENSSTGGEGTGAPK